jgi:hypothetical protein
MLGPVITGIGTVLRQLGEQLKEHDPHSMLIQILKIALISTTGPP